MTKRNLIRTFFNSHQVFRPEVEAMLDAELNRHQEVVKKLLAYAEHDRKRAETAGEADGGNERAVRRPGAATLENVDDSTTDGRTEPG